MQRDAVPDQDREDVGDPGRPQAWAEPSHSSRGRPCPMRARSSGQTRTLTVTHETNTMTMTCISAGLAECSLSLLSWWSYCPAPEPGGRPGTPRWYVSPGPRLRDDLIAQVDAFNANRHAGNGDQHVDLRLRFTAETAFQVVAIHRRFPFIAIWHHYQPTGDSQQPCPAEQPAPDPVPGLGAAD